MLLYHVQLHLFFIALLSLCLTPLSILKTTNKRIYWKKINSRSALSESVYLMLFPGFSTFFDQQNDVGLFNALSHRLF